MEHKASTARSNLEQLLVDETAEPKALPLSLLEDITGDFSDDQEIGSGGFAVVYKGILGARAVAVKKLSDAFMDETKFHREVECLMRVKHKNVVRFLGYCADRQGSMEKYDGKLVMADVHQRLLCFEYIPKGSLDKYIIDPHRKWRLCYKIIIGICEGLQNLHDNHIIHMDLKPANILLDDNMSPKITDFGLSRCFNENQSRDITKNILGTMGYLAPEFNEGGVIARSTDLYSLGVIIIEILTGQKGYQATEEVLESWRGRLERSQEETLCEQIRLCYETALECRDFNPMKRPASAQNIIDRLHQMENIQKMNRDKDGEGGEQKKNPDKLRNGEQKKNPDKGDEGGEQKKNSYKDGGGGEQKKNPDKEDDGGEHKKPIKGSQLQPKEDKEQKQQPEETKPTDVGTQEETTVLLRIRIHCDACADRIRRRIYRVKGVEDVFLDMTKHEVKVRGTMDVAAMVVYLRDKLNRPMEAVVPAKKDDKNGKGNSEKKLEDEAAAPEEVHKDKGKGIEVAAVGGGEQAPRVSMVPAPVEASSSPAYVQPQGPPPSYYNYYGCNADGRVGYVLNYDLQHLNPQPYQLYPPHFFNMAPPPQMFSDENPNACSVM